MNNAILTKTMRIIIIMMLLTVCIFWLKQEPVEAARLKDIAHIQGVRDNQLVGYGLVVGLNGTGDTAATAFTFQSIVSMLERLGVTVPKSSLTVKNVAAVIVTADLGAFMKEGNRIDCTVSSVGNATDLKGGTLLMTPLQGPDGKVYAVAQGALSVGGFEAGGGAGQAGGMSLQKNHPTVARIPQGALIEKEVPADFVIDDALRIILAHPDFTTCDRLSKAINETLGKVEYAQPKDASTIRVYIPEEYKDNIIGLLAKLEKVEVNPDSVATVVINERTGTIVAGEHVRISTVAVAHGNLSIEIKSRHTISQPLPFSRAGSTVAVPETEVTAEEENARLIVLKEGVDIAEVASALNTLGVTPRDMIAIFQAMKEAGAFQAELKII